VSPRLKLIIFTLIVTAMIGGFAGISWLLWGRQ
jgi:hypothetical protein